MIDNQPSYMLSYHRVVSPKSVLRQFGLRQTVSSLCYINTQLHQIDLKDENDQDWQQLHADYISSLHASRDHCAREVR